MRQTSIRDILLATALIGTGTGSIVSVLRYNFYNHQESVALAILLWFGGGPLILMGLALPFGLRKYGWLIGIVIQGIAVVVLAWIRMYLAAK